MIAIQNVYMVDGPGRFQVDCDEASYVFGPSRFRAGGVECFEYHPKESKPQAHDAFLASIIWVNFTPRGY